MILMLFLFFFFFKQKTAYEMRISDWSSDVCSSDLRRSPTGGPIARESDQPALLHRRFDEAGEQRMRVKRLRFQLRVELHADKPRMIGPLDDFGQRSVGRHARKDQPVLFQRFAVVDVHLIAVAMPLADLACPIDGGRMAVA